MHGRRTQPSKLEKFWEFGLELGLDEEEEGEEGGVKSWWYV